MFGRIFFAPQALPSSNLRLAPSGAVATRRLRWTPARLLSAVVAAIVGTCISAAQPIPPDADYIVTQWDTESGLPHNSVKAIHQTRDGYLWIGTDQGLARFDGIRFIVFDENTSGGVLSGQVTSLAETAEGSLWVGTTKGLVRYHLGRFVLFTQADGIKTTNDIVNVLCTGADGSLLIGTRDGITRWTDGKFVQNIDSSAYDFLGLRAICTDRSGVIWISIGSAILRYDHGHITRFGEEHGLPRSGSKVTTDAADNILAATQSGVFVLRGNRFVAHDENPRLANASVNVVRSDGAGNLWVGSPGGLNRYSDGSAALIRDQAGNGLGAVYAIFEDQEGSIWVGAANGLFRVIRARGYSFAASEGSTRVVGLAVTQTQDDAVWLASYGYGIDRIKDGVVTHFRVDAPLSHDVIKCIYQAPDSTMWFGTRGSTLDHMVDGRVTTYVYQPGMSTGRPVSAIHVEKDGTVWLGISRRGLLRLKDDQIVQAEGAADLASETVWAIATLRDGRLVIGTSKGLYHRTAEQHWLPLPVRGVQAPLVIRSILEVENDTLWLATDGEGLVRWRGGAGRSYGAAAGLIDNNIFSVLRDGLGNLWISTAKGIARIREADFDEVDQGKITTVNCTVFGRADGLLSSSSAGAGYPAAALTRDGRLITGTDRGFAVIEPRSVRANVRPPNVVIESVSADDTGIPVGERLTIPPGTNRLEFRFTALSLVAPERVRFRYQLQGSDRTWIEAENQRTATYTHLAPGTYTFRVQACNNDGVWNTAGASLQMEILPRFYQTRTFLVMTTLFGLGAVGAGVGFTVRRKMQEKLRQLEQQNAMEKERLRIARDLHDELGAGITEVGLLADQIVDAAPSDISQQLAGLAFRIRRLGTDLSGIVWTMSVKYTTLADLAQFLRRYAERVFRNTGIRCIVSGVDSLPACPLSPTNRHEVLAAVKETLNNIIRHANATEARIHLEFTGNAFEVHVSDNGCGFSPECTKDASLNGNGLRNMHARMEEVHGRVLITSEPGHGTRVVFCVPCAAQINSSVSSTCRSR